MPKEYNFSSINPKDIFHCGNDEVFSILVAVSRQVRKNLNDFLKIIEPSIIF
jgi:hypothetical protein